VGKNATDVVQRYDREYESQQLALSLQGAVAATAAFEVGAIGVGAGVVAVATTAAADVTGITAALVIAGVGLFILPRQRRKAREEFHEKTDDLRVKLGEVVRRQFDTEINRSIERMREAISPYTRFVRTEHARMTEARSSLAISARETEALRGEIEAPGVKSPSGP
jgi:ABC-type anion transport system duplicated permease subunit